MRQEIPAVNVPTDNPKTPEVGIGSEAVFVATMKDRIKKFNSSARLGREVLVAWLAEGLHRHDLNTIISRNVDLYALEVAVSFLEVDMRSVEEEGALLADMSAEDSLSQYVTELLSQSVRGGSPTWQTERHGEELGRKLYFAAHDLALRHATGDGLELVPRHWRNMVERYSDDS